MNTNKKIARPIPTLVVMTPALISLWLRDSPGAIPRWRSSSSLPFALALREHHLGDPGLAPIKLPAGLARSHNLAHREQISTA